MTLLVAKSARSTADAWRDVLTTIAPAPAGTAVSSYLSTPAQRQMLMFNRTSHAGR